MHIVRPSLLCMDLILKCLCHYIENGIRFKVAITHYPLEPCMCVHALFLTIRKIMVTRGLESMILKTEHWVGSMGLMWLLDKR